MADEIITKGRTECPSYSLKEGKPYCTDYRAPCFFDGENYVDCGLVQLTFQKNLEDGLS